MEDGVEEGAALLLELSLLEDDEELSELEELVDADLEESEEELDEGPVEVFAPPLDFSFRA